MSERLSGQTWQELADQTCQLSAKHNTEAADCAGLPCTIGAEEGRTSGAEALHVGQWQLPTSSWQVLVSAKRQKSEAPLKSISMIWVVPQLSVSILRSQRKSHDPIFRHTKQMLRLPQSQWHLGSGNDTGMWNTYSGISNKKGGKDKCSLKVDLVNSLAVLKL